MEQLHSKVILCIQNNADVEDARRILSGELTVTAAAESRGQNDHFFHGDADVLVLSFTTSSTMDKTLMEVESKDALAKVDTNKIFQRVVCPAVANSSTTLELIVRYCNLSTETIISLSDAIRLNTGLIGFTVMGNPGDTSEMGVLALKYACIHSQAPLMYFQGSLLDQAIIDLREEAAEVDSIDMEQCETYDRSDTLDTINTTMSAVSSPIAMNRNLAKSPTWLAKSPRNEPKPRYCRRVATEPCMGKQPPPGSEDFPTQDDGLHARSWRPERINWMKQI